MKAKKLLCLVLVFAMVLGTMGTVAFAEDAEADVWDGTVDTSWYDVDETEFTITTAEQFAGLAYLVNGAQSFNPALDNYTTADFGYYSEGNKSARPDETATENSISFEGKTIYLASDLDLCPVDANGELVKLPGNEQLSMMPVGYSKYTPFKGTFNGQGHTIKNLFQGGWDLYGLNYKNVYVGLFGCVEDATISNLVIDNFAFNCEMNLGGVAAISSGTSTFDGITIKNSTIATGGGWWVGGLIGWAYGNQTIQNIDIDETNTIAQVGGHYDTAVGGIIGGCNNVDGESIAFINCDVACKLDVYNDCTANYNTNSYRNCGMVIGGVGEDNEIIIDGKKYPDFEAKGLTFDNVNVTIGEWANYTYCWSYDLPKNCQRIEPGVGYKGVDVSTVTDPTIDTSRPFDAIFGAENAGDLNNVRGDVDVRVMEFLGIEGVNVVDKAHLALYAAEVYEYSDIERAATLIYVDSFATLQEAIDSIGSDEGEYVIRVIKNIEEDVEIKQNPNQKITIAGDETNKPVISGTIKINGRSQRYATAAITIENIAFDASDISGDTVIKTGWDNNSRYVSNLTVSNCDFVDETSSKEVVAIKDSTGGCVNFKIIDCTASGLHSFTQFKNVEIMKDGEIVREGYGVVVDNCTVTDCKNGIHLGYSAATVTDTTVSTDGYGIRSGNSGALNYAVDVTLENNTINAGEQAVYLREGSDTVNLSVASGSYFAGEGCVAIENSTGNSTVAISGGLYSSNVDDYLVDGYALTRTGNGYLVVEDSEADDEGKDQADTISIEYKDVTVLGTEGEKTYAIVVKANEGDEIHDLASVDLSLVFTEAPVTNGDITFTVAPAEKFAITEHDSTVREELTKRYMFNYNGVDAYQDSGAAITVGTITVTGYGSFTIATADVATNIVNATTLYDNLVDSYTAAGATDDDSTTGGLIINENTVVDDDMVGEITDGVIAVPVRTLKVNVTFPNALDSEDNVVAYQNMKVQITGNIDGVNQTITYNLGKGEEATDVAMNADGAYVFEENRLVLNESYTVTVSGAGYRTARYTVRMTDHKELKFWNNVMDEAQVIEIGNDSVVTVKNFLAGDIVKDNNINIYDLSAVVSYFGTEGLSATNHPEYAKYDLNRDNVIDSKDVAYVLVSWGE